ncbi:MAG: ABC transporter permease [Hyphomicrobiales bacterium]|nr:ABC transporter permease [Hyphomicrobiales bacterium]
MTSQAAILGGADLSGALRVRKPLRARLGPALLVAPLLAFLVVGYVLPILGVLWRSVDNTEFRTELPRTVKALASFDGGDLPPESAYEALHQDLVDAQNARSVGIVARRLNLVTTGYRSLILSTAAKAQAMRPPYREAFAAADPRWGETAIWVSLRRLSRPVVPDFLLVAIDLEESENGIRHVDPDRAIYLDVLWRTFEISLLVCGLCLVLGAPLAFLIAAKPRWSNVLLTFVLLPFWMSLLARTAAWVALLQSQGLVNKALLELGLIAQPLALMFNRAGVLIAMTHILLPYMVLPLYASMRAVPIELVRAGISLGASPLTVLSRVYLPLILPGITAGAMLVMILALGYYITPALVGGTQDQMLSYFVAFNASQVLNWGLASALAVLLLLVLALLFALYRLLARVAGPVPA